VGSLFNIAEIEAMSGGFRPPAPKNYKLPSIFPDFSKAKRLSLDLESKDHSIAAGTGPGWRRDAFICGFAVALGDEKGNIEFSEYYPLRHKGGPNLDEERVYDWLRDQLAFFTGEIVGANLLYDADGFQYQNIIAPCAKWRDVQWAEALIDENAFNYYLNRLSKKYIGHGKLTDELLAMYGPDYKERMDEVHPGHMRTYGCGDVEQPLQILNAQAKELKHQHLTEVFDLESRLLPMLLYMRRKGQPVDMTAATRLHDTFTQKRQESLTAATKAAGLRGFQLTVENFGKPREIQKALDHLGLTNYPRTEKKGQPSITDAWLEATEHPFGHYLAAANKYDKALETFVNGYISDYAINGRVHCEFHPLKSVNGKGKANGTVAGRFSGANPNLQNIPVRDDEIGPLLRAAFIPEPDYDYFSGDYSQIEYREIVHAAVVRAQMPREKAQKMWGAKNGLDIWDRLQSAYKTQEKYINDPTTDFHTFMATLTGLQRKYAKSVNFAVAFVQGLQAFAEGLGWVDENGKANQKAIDTLATYHGAVPFVKAVGQAMTYEANEDGYTTSLLNRRAHYDLWEPRFYEEGKPRAKALPREQALAEYGEKIKRSMTHASLNRYTQMGGADMMKTTMTEVWESGILNGDDLIISLTVHDELDGSVARTPRGQECLRELQHMMENAIKLTVPTTTEFKTGKNWAETH
jgi:DNA polymerase I-like protein with 3'-5' exonuclease and polymerase domains